MSIYLTKYVHVEVPDYEVEIEIEAEDVLNEIDGDELLDHVIDHCDAATILDKIDSDSIVEYLTRSRNKHALAALLRQIATNLDVE